MTITDAIDIWENEGGALHAPAGGGARDVPADDGALDVPVEGGAQSASERRRGR